MTRSGIEVEIESLAILGMGHMRAFMEREGDEQPASLAKAKLGAVALGAYTRMRATRANERALLLAARRQKIMEGVQPIAQLPASTDGNDGDE